MNKRTTTEKRLSVRLYLSLVLYTVVGFGLVILLDYIFSKFNNSILSWIYLRIDEILLYLIQI